MNFLVYVYRLWRMKYWIFIITIASVLLGYYMTSLMSETYQAQALIFVKRNPALSPFERKDIDPPVFQDLLLTDALLHSVKEQYNKRYANDEQIFKIFRKRFRVSGAVLTETAVRKDYSPIVTITATAGSAESAAYLVNTWQTLAIQTYGDLLAKEHEMYYNYLLNEYNTIDASIQSAQVQFSAGKWKLATNIQEFSNWMDILAPSTLTVLPTEPKSAPPIEIGETSPNTFELSISDQNNQADRKGLQNNLIELDIEISKLNEEAETLRALLKDESPSVRLKGTDTERLQELLADKITPEAMKEVMAANTGGEQFNPHYRFIKEQLVDAEKNLRAKKAARQLVTEKIAEVSLKITTLQAAISEMEPQVQKARREIERLKKEKSLIEERMNLTALSFRQLKWSSNEPLDTSTLFSVMPANAPYRVGPKRLTYTGLIGIGTLLFVTLLIMLMTFVGELEAMYGTKSPAMKAAPASGQSRPQPDDPDLD